MDYIDDEELEEEYEDDDEVIEGLEREFTTDVEGNLENLREISIRIKELTDKIISYEKKEFFMEK